jgi:plasmid rolling circle replication initiator protein Rep
MLVSSDTQSIPNRCLESNSQSQDPKATGPEYLSECSPKDRPWDRHRSQADDVAGIYLGEREFSRLGERVQQCSSILGFAWSPEKGDSTVLTLKLRTARFCRVRLCPCCQWRRALMWMARFHQAHPEVLARCPGTRPVFLTLTRKNVPVGQLRVALRAMSKAWGRMRKRTEFAAVLGWIRTVEVTRGQDGSAHPHYHALLMVPGEYFRRSSGKYVDHVGWVKMWRESLQVDYDPSVHVVACKPKHGVLMAGGEMLPAGAGWIEAARETLKYAVKPCDMTADRNWFLELTRQLHKLRFIASGGALKDVLRERDETNDDLLVLGDGETDDGARLYFGWERPVRRYKRWHIQ